MDTMNLFGDSKPKKKTYSENFKKKAVKLASRIGVAKAAEKLEVSVSYLVDESGGEFEDDVYELIDIFKRLGSKRDKKIAVEQLKVLLNVI